MKAVPSGFQRAGDLDSCCDSPSTGRLSETRTDQEFGSSEYAKTISGDRFGEFRRVSSRGTQGFAESVLQCPEQSLIHSARDVSDGGLAVAFARAGFAEGIGASRLSCLTDGPTRPNHLFRGPERSHIVTWLPRPCLQLRTSQKGSSPDVAVVGQTGGFSFAVRLYDHVDIAEDPLSRLYAELDASTSGIAACGGGGDRMSVNGRAVDGWRGQPQRPSTAAAMPPPLRMTIIW